MKLCSSLVDLNEDRQHFGRHKIARLLSDNIQKLQSARSTSAKSSCRKIPNSKFLTKMFQKVVAKMCKFYLQLDFKPSTS